MTSVPWLLMAAESSRRCSSVSTWAVRESFRMVDLLQVNEPKRDIVPGRPYRPQRRKWQIVDHDATGESWPRTSERGEAAADVFPALSEQATQCAQTHCSSRSRRQIGRVWCRASIGIPSVAKPCPASFFMRPRREEF